MNIRQPIAAGQFYPDNPNLLKKEINIFFNKVEEDKIKAVKEKNIKALVVPHAGYQYSGLVAAYGFKVLQNQYQWEKIVLIGPSHYYYFQKMAISPSDFWLTPLGEIERLKLENIYKKDDFNSLVIESEEIHREEHCLEVELPFLQIVLKNNFKILPILLSEFDYEKGSKFLAEAIDDKTLIIVSSDLSHYFPYEEAIQKDYQTIDCLLRQDINGLIEKGDACGIIPLLVLTALSKEKQWIPSLLKYANSGDMTGDYSAVVGYGAIAYTAE